MSFILTGRWGLHFLIRLKHLLYIPNVSVARSCSYYNGVSVRSIGNISYLNNPNICCPRSCGTNCNECNGNEALQPQYCSFDKGNMCFQGAGGQKCCATSIAHYQICHHGIGRRDPPCRLRMYINYYSYLRCTVWRSISV